MQYIRLFYRSVFLAFLITGCNNYVETETDLAIKDSLKIKPVILPVDYADEPDVIASRSDYEIQINAEKYSELKNRLKVHRDSLYNKYSQADSIERKIITDQAANYIFNTITGEMFEYWYGTPWDFNGTTTIPGKGTIACGYFITTVLKDAGFDIPRFKWAQLSAEMIVKKISTNYDRFYNKTIEEIKVYIENKEDGLYVVGLDCHVGFIYKKNEEIKFVHSNYYQPDIGVMSENFETENPLKNSGYRIIGRILDDEMVTKWILNEKFE